MSLYNDLTNAGYPGPESQIVADAFQNEVGSAWLFGLEQIAQTLETGQKPQLPIPPASEPWKTIYGRMMANGADPGHAYADALKAWPGQVASAIETIVGVWTMNWQKAHPTTSAAPKKRKHTKTAEYIQAMTQMGYTFRLNELVDTIEVNGAPISDPMAAEIRCRLRDIGLIYVNNAEDAYIAYARRNVYHPIRYYLNSLTWDGMPHISALAAHVTDEYGVFELWLRKWLIGAVAKAYRGLQNSVLVWDGPQGIGKSQLVRWLCPPALSQYFSEASLDLKDKDSYIRLVNTFVWELGEFGQTLRRLDRETLKNFVTMQSVKVRKPYDRYDTNKPALASMIGTVNNESGILDDPTGSRRFWVTRIQRIDWAYTSLDINQIWAEAVAAYNTGEKWQLDRGQAEQSEEINSFYEVDDPVEYVLLKLFFVDKARHDLWTPTGEIIAQLEPHLKYPSTKALSMALSQTATRMGLKKGKTRQVGKPPVSGFYGIGAKSP